MHEGDVQSNMLAPIESAGIMRQKDGLNIGDLERYLLSRYDPADAEDWDVTGLTVGDPAKPVLGVSVALDVTLDAIEACADGGGNVLLTHHPVFLDAPRSIGPAHSAAPLAGSAVWLAVKRDVALINIHTALDVHTDGNGVLARLLSLDGQGVIAQIGDSVGKGYGRICSVRDQDRPLTLKQLAARCLSVFGRPCRVWGDEGTKVESVCAATGSAGDLAPRCLEAGIQCLICGEIRYHAALDVVQRGLCVIELGHDVSELPLAAVLAAAAVDAGVPAESVSLYESGSMWWSPDATRI